MKTAVVLFNLGGPDSLAAVQPFLQNLFSDPAIIRAPALVRWILARLISRRRAPIAQKIYEKLGGCSPILENTKAQAAALQAALGENHKCFIVMRYWHPRAAEVVKEVEAYQPDTVVLLPLYPQFSTTTTQSSLDEFLTHYQKPVKTIGCYPVEGGFIAAQAALIRPLLEQAAQQGRPRLLFSAHGLPEKIIKGGDPYQGQCEQTAKAIVERLNWPDLDWLNCYQSRVGPLRWIGPSTEDEIMRAGKDKVPVVLAPIAFVSEHSETLVELDIEYRELADEHAVPFYGRVPTVGTHPDFIKALAALVRTALDGQKRPRLCPETFSACRCSF